MLTPIDFIPRSQPRRRRRQAVPSSLLLAAASYQSGVSVTLVFNQPIDIASIAANSAELQDGPASKVYLGASAMLIDAFTVKIALTFAFSLAGSEVKLTFAEPTGIKTVFSDQTWTGVNDLVLPFP